MKPLIPPPVIGAATAFVLWGVDRLSSTVLSLPESIFHVDFPGRLGAAFALIGLGLMIDLVSIAAFFQARTTVNPLAPSRAEKLVVTGFYLWSRNPMYLGMLMMLMGWALMLANPLGVAPLILFVIVITEWQIKPEERALEEKFGDDYRAYRDRVRRWV